MTKEQRREYFKAYYAENRERIHKRQRDYLAASPDRRRAKNRRHDLKQHYGITPADYQALFSKQGGLCAICKSSSPQRKGSNHFAVDHCHVTGKVRGLLCHNCNVALGAFKDSFDSLVAAAKYIQAAHNII